VARLDGSLRQNRLLSDYRTALVKDRTAGQNRPRLAFLMNSKPASTQQQGL
jgi:hypothetical protein